MMSSMLMCVCVAYRVLTYNLLKVGGMCCVSVFILFAVVRTVTVVVLFLFVYFVNCGDLCVSIHETVALATSC
jgi:hypothetical protein